MGSENSVLKPLDELDLKEVRIAVLSKDFSKLIEKIEVKAKEDVDRVFGEAESDGQGGARHKYNSKG